MVLRIAEHTENEELLVIYVSLEGAHLPGPRMRARPVTGTDGWFTPVVIDGISEPRFRYVGTTIHD